jgi:hypothetical protein
MNENANSNLLGASGGPQLKRVTRLLRRAQDSLHTARGKAPSYAELEDWTGVAEGTVKDWFANNGRPTAEFLLQLLERIPERMRLEILTQACRLCPTLDHPRMKCDQTIISQLKSISGQSHGFTLIVGGNGESRTFLQTAMANAFLGMTTRPHKIAGIDVHEPDWFVPVPGVRYLHNLFHPVGLRERVQFDWPQIRTGGAQLIVLNGLWSAFPNIQNDLWALADSTAIIVADSAIFKPSPPKRTKTKPIHVITISTHLENSKEILVRIEAA